MRKILYIILLISLLTSCRNNDELEELNKKVSISEERVIELQNELDAFKAENRDLMIRIDDLVIQKRDLEIINTEKANEVYEMQLKIIENNSRFDRYYDVLEKLLKTPETYLIKPTDIDFMLEMLPNGWVISTSSDGQLAIAKGDINGDKYRDLAVIIEEVESGDRRLLIYLADDEDTYNLQYECNNAVLNVYAGGGFGNPLSSLIIEDNELVLNFYGRSFNRFFMDYRFGFIDDGLKLIWASTGWHVPTEEDVFVVSIEVDYLTGKLTEVDLIHGELVNKERTIEIQELMLISDFIPIMLQSPDVQY